MGTDTRTLSSQPVPDPFPDMKEMLLRVLHDTGYAEARSSKMDIDDFLRCVPEKVVMMGVVVVV